MEARNRSSVTGVSGRHRFGLMPQRKFRRRDNIRLRQILGHAYAHRVAPIFIIAARRQPHVACQNLRVQRAARQVVHRCRRVHLIRILEYQPGPAHSVLTAARERRLRQIEAHQQSRAGTHKPPIRSVDGGFWTAGNEPRDEIPWWFHLLRLSTLPEYSSLRCPAPEPAASRPEWLSVAKCCHRVGWKKYS
jgi:hypothetical protein